MEDHLKFAWPKSREQIHGCEILRHEITAKADQIAELAGAEIIDDRRANIRVPPLQFQGEVRADKSGAASDQSALHV